MEVNNLNNIFEVLVLGKTDSPSAISELRSFSTLDILILKFSLNLKL